MNVFNKVLEREHADDTRLGMPARDASHAVRRATALSNMTGNRGFRVQPDEPRKNADGTTRGQRKRKARVACRAAETSRQHAACMKLVEAGIPYERAAQRFGSLAFMEAA